MIDESAASGRGIMPMLAVTMLLAIPLAGCNDDGLGPVTAISAQFDFDRDASAASGFHVIGINGDVEVTGISQGETLHVSGFRRVENCRRSTAEAWLDELEVSVTTSGQEIIIQTLQPDNTTPCSLVVHYEVTVPRRLGVRILNVNGAVTVDGMDAGVAVTAVNGAVVLSDVVGGAEVQLTNGPIVADLEIDGTERIDLQTVNGAIDLDIPADTDAMLLASVVNGAISLSGLTVSDPVSTPTSITGRLGTGAGQISVRTTNGAIALTGR
jgi:DUF4097 and DUF4098 domain-containing protein YvlB